VAGCLSTFKFIVQTANYQVKYTKEEKTSTLYSASGSINDCMVHTVAAFNVTNAPLSLLLATLAAIWPYCKL